MSILCNDFYRELGFPMSSYRSVLKQLSTKIKLRFSRYSSQTSPRLRCWLTRWVPSHCLPCSSSGANGNPELRYLSGVFSPMEKRSRHFLAPLDHLLFSFQKIDLTRLADCQRPQASASSAYSTTYTPLCLLCLARYAEKLGTKLFIAQSLRTLWYKNLSFVCTPCQYFSPMQERMTQTILTLLDYAKATSTENCMVFCPYSAEGWLPRRCFNTWEA